MMGGVTAAASTAELEKAKTAVAKAEHDLNLARKDAIIAMNTITELRNDLYEQQQRAEAAEEQVQQLEVTATELKQQVTRQLAVVEVTQDSTSALRGVVSEAIAELRVITDTADDADTTNAFLTRTAAGAYDYAITTQSAIAVEVEACGESPSAAPSPPTTDDFMNDVSCDVARDVVNDVTGDVAEEGASLPDASDDVQASITLSTLLKTKHCT
eukprot:3312-Heterococcus_DN1.PRE.9